MKEGTNWWDSPFLTIPRNSEYCQLREPGACMCVCVCLFKPIYTFQMLQIEWDLSKVNRELLRFHEVRFDLVHNKHHLWNIYPFKSFLPLKCPHASRYRFLKIEFPNTYINIKLQYLILGCCSVCSRDSCGRNQHKSRPQYHFYCGRFLSAISNSHKRKMQEAVCDSVFDSFMCALAVLMFVMVIFLPQLVEGEELDAWEWS